MTMELPISLKVANAKGKILSCVNMASVEYNLPAFILEGIIADVLAEMRSQAKIEVLNDFNLILKGNEKEDENDDKKFNT